MISIIPTKPCHLDRIWQIEQLVHSHPWSKASINNLSSRGAIHHVILEEDLVIGYFYAQNIVDEVSLLNIAIAKECQNRGFGRRLLQFLTEYSEQKKAESIWLEVRAGNQNAVHLYESVGFNEIDRRENYYPSDKGREDAIIMTLTL
ncbi:ribosomal protein S18-alanine N-acetyltransferase [Vibrio salinus]|uniref:ribosomal protein S18-alanine N-acetyltransferase n=1 Tax=Vibrio salinus TaxID=2899784 RepID=UPI001E614A1D|nr:ribosomal protein S18-alanine N-acetyltransferase [Vibrio salinus]MCE0493313.1 ribosomal protein S18-alanine N-acetyltransferase [Vibrio salinus]